MPALRTAALALLTAGLCVPSGAGAAAAVRPVTGEGEREAPAAAAWQVDPASGRRFRIVRLPRSPAAYLVLDDGTIRLPGGTSGVLEREEADWIWVRVFEVPAFELDASAPEAPVAADPGAGPGAMPLLPPPVDRLSLEPFDAGLPRSGQWRNGFDLADFDGDGQIDLAHGPARKSHPARPAIFLGDGKGGWSLWEAARFPARPYDYGGAAAGDLDGDGHTDLVLAMHLLGIQILRGDGRGGFEPWAPGDAPAGAAAGFTSVAVRIADWNGDGRPDLVALGEGPRLPAPGSGAPLDGSRGVLVLLNRGPAPWAPVVPEQGGLAREFGPALALADFDRDGRLDAVVATRRLGGRQIVGLGTAGGELRPTVLDALPERALTEAVAAADLDGDGRTDLALGYRRDDGGGWRTGLVVEFGGGDRRRPPLTPLELPGGAGVRGLAAGDLNGDGHADLAAGTGDGEIWLLLGDGRGGFLREAAPELPPARDGCSVYGLALADLDGDGRDELLAGYASDENASTIRGPDRSGCSRQGSLRAWKPIPRGGPGEAH